MHIAVIGGKLQGTEAAYLAGKAGWEVTVIDKNNQPPAKGLCHHFRQLDIRNGDEFKASVKDVDTIIPALEDLAALQALQTHCRDLDIPLIFDDKAYQISSSKLHSNSLFKKAGVRIPVEWPDCGFPAIAKPSQASGSHGICMLSDVEEYTALQTQLSDKDDPWVIQKYMDGPSYSLEVIGHKGHYIPLQVTDLEMDEIYDCKRVTAPSNLTETLKKEFNTIAVTLAEALALNGIMDVEVILNDEQLFVLEIDARLPSQTPTAVIWSSGYNLLECLWEMTKGTCICANMTNISRYVIYEHIHVMPKRLLIAGEHLMANSGPLRVVPGFYGADEGITNFHEGKSEWVATLITTDSTSEGVQNKRNGILSSICQRFGIDSVTDSGPHE
jgi:pyrrolysine biosynthesis protein PylC